MTLNSPPLRYSSSLLSSSVLGCSKLNLPLLDAHLVREDTQPRLAHAHDTQLVADTRLVFWPRIDLVSALTEQPRGRTTMTRSSFRSYVLSSAVTTYRQLALQAVEAGEGEAATWTHAAQPQPLGEDEQIILLRPAYLANNTLMERKVGDMSSLSRHGGECDVNHCVHPTFQTNGSRPPLSTSLLSTFPRWPRTSTFRSDPSAISENVLDMLLECISSPSTVDMFARRALPLARPARAFSTTSLRLQDKSALEAKLRDGLKTAMKARDKATVSTLKVSAGAGRGAWGGRGREGTDPVHEWGREGGRQS